MAPFALMPLSAGDKLGAEFLIKRPVRYRLAELHVAVS